MNVGGFLREAARQHPDRPAITFAGRTTTYAQLDARTDALAAGMARLGIQPGDRVVLWMHNHQAFIETMLACWKRGIVVVPVNARLEAGDVAFSADDCGAVALVHGAEFAAGAADVVVKHRIGVEGGEVDYETLVLSGRGAQEDETLALDDGDPAWLFYTSGTTGRPKGAILTHGNLTFLVVAWCADFHQLQPHDVVLHCAPLSHAAGFHALVAVARGSHAIIAERFDPAAVLDAIATYGVSSTWLVPTQIRMLLDDPGFDAADLSSVVRVIYGGAPMPLEDVKEAIRRFGPVLCQLYGQGESPMTISYLRPSEHDADRPDQEALTSAGVVRTGMELQIVDPAGRPLPAGQTGEITVRGPAVMSGYWGRPEASAEALRDGWLHTGDVGRLDEGARLYIVDRLKDVVISGGTNVYAREVEDVLMGHPQIKDAAVFGVPDRKWGEAVTAAVVVTGPATEADILSFCRERLAGFKRPKRVHVVPALPRNAYGKVLKRDLRERFRAPDDPIGRGGQPRADASSAGDEAGVGCPP